MNQDCLHLISGMMRQKQPVRPVPLGTLLKKSEPGPAGGELDGNFLPRGRGRHVDLADLQFQAVLPGEVMHETGIPIRCLAAQLMVQVAENQLAIPGFKQRMQQRHGIATAGDSEQVPVVRSAITGNEEVH
jgi:hypothetical protein